MISLRTPVLALLLGSLACATETSPALDSTASANTITPFSDAPTATLINVGIAQFELVVKGTFPVCASRGTPGISEVRLTHPRPRDIFGRLSTGTLAVTVEDEGDIRVCHAIIAAPAEFHVRLDSSTMGGPQDRRIHQLSPRFDSDYKVVVNGATLGTIRSGAGLMSFDTDEPAGAVEQAKR